MWWEAVLFLQGMVRWCLGRILSQVMWLSAGILHRDKTHKGAGQSGGWCPFSGETLSLGGAVGLTFAQMRKSDGRTEWCNVTFCFLYVPHLQAKKKNTYRRRMTAWLRWEPSSAPWLVATFSTSVRADVGHGEISVISGTLTDSVPFCCCFFYGSRAGGAGWTLGDPSSTLRRSHIWLKPTVEYWMSVL